MSDKPIDADCAGKLTILPGERVDELQQAGLRILQKEQGFRFGMDAVLLSSFVRAEKVGTKKFLRFYKPFIGGRPPVNGL